VVEPAVDKINERSNVVTPQTATGLSRILGVGRTKASQWFQTYKTFCVPFVALDVQFLELQGKFAIRLERHFYILDLMPYVLKEVPLRHC
jgi:hypothetical protein